MNKDIIFRSVNALGFIANAASLCMPYAAPMRYGCKAVSRFCNLVSYIVLPSGLFDKGWGKSIVNAACILAFSADGSSMSGIDNATPEIVAQDGVTRYMRDSASAAVQLLNVVRGINPDETKSKTLTPH